MSTKITKVEGDVTHIETDNDFNAQGCMDAARAYRKAFAEGRLTLEGRGHDMRVATPENINMLLDTDAFYPWSHARIDKIIGYLDNPIEGEFNEDTWEVLRSDAEYCGSCGRRIRFCTNGRVIKGIECEFIQPGFHMILHDRDCQYKDGLPNPTVEIDIPSGQMVLGNDLREFFTDEVEWSNDDKELEYTQDYSICHYNGHIKHMNRHAGVGMATAYMGSGAIDVYISDTSIILGRGRLVDPENDDDTREKTIVLDGIEHQLVAAISFGLWWYGAADLARMIELNQKKALKIKPPKPLNKHGWPHDYSGYDLFRVSVQPGRWRMTQYGEGCRDPSFDMKPNEDGITILSRLQRIGD